MKRLKLTAASAALFAAASAMAQDSLSASNQWWTYLADYDGKPGSTRLDMGFKAQAPIQALPQVVISGVKYRAALAGGLPDTGQLNQLNPVSDAIVAAILATGPAVYVGTFTHDGEQVNYVYVANTSGVREAVDKALKRACETCELVYRVRQDPEWNAYLKFLYPNQATLDFYRHRPAQGQ